VLAPFYRLTHSSITYLLTYLLTRHIQKERHWAEFGRGRWPELCRPA